MSEEIEITNLEKELKTMEERRHEIISRLIFLKLRREFEKWFGSENK